MVAVCGIENPKSVFIKNKLNCRLMRPHHTFPLSFGSSEMGSGPENSAAFLHRIDVWLSPCVIEFQVAFLDAAVDCAK